MKGAGKVAVVAMASLISMMGVLPIAPASAAVTLPGLNFEQAGLNAAAAGLDVAAAGLTLPQLWELEGSLNAVPRAGAWAMFDALPAEQQALVLNDLSGGTARYMTTPSSPALTCDKPPACDVTEITQDAATYSDDPVQTTDVDPGGVPAAAGLAVTTQCKDKTLTRTLKSIIFRATVYKFNQDVHWCYNGTNLFNHGNVAYPSEVVFPWEYKTPETAHRDTFAPFNNNATDWECFTVAEFSYTIPKLGFKNAHYGHLRQHMTATGAYHGSGSAQ